MGRFSTTVHIKNEVDRMRFVNTFSDVMKKRGFAPCSEDEAAVSYLMVFGEGWVTLANEDYKDNPKKSAEDIREMSKALKTSAFSVEVVDSDFAIMTLCAANGAEDRVVVGDGSGYGVDEAGGDRKLWEPLLADGNTWEQFSEAAAAQEVFVEDALGKVAAVLGIDPYYIDSDYDEVSAKADDNNNITAFYFKKAKGKSMSLNAAFVKVFGEALEPLGFKKIKSKYPYFVRVVPGSEIIHVISYYKKQSFDPQYDLIDIVGGVATVYRQKIDFQRNPKNENWFRSNWWIYSQQHPEDRDSNFKRRLYEFKCSKDGKQMIKDLGDALDITKQIMLPVLDKVVNIDSCIEFSPIIGMNMQWYEDEEDFSNTNLSHYYYEGFLYFMTDKKFFRNRMRCAASEFALRMKSFFEKVCSEPPLYDMVKSELERRKALNVDVLRSYGLDL